MIDPLFIEFFSAVEDLILWCRKITTLSSEDGKKDNLPTEGIKEGWINRSNEVQHRLDKLKIDLENNLKDSPQKIDSQLVYFRQFSRIVSEAPPEWSAYYDDIDKAMDDLCQIIFKIDVKYILGNVKIRKEQNEKNNQSES